MQKNFILDTDSYKICHWKMAEEFTETVYSYCEARKGSEYKNVTFFGLQYILKEQLCGEVVTQGMLIEAREIINPHLGSEEFLYLEMWQVIIDEFNGHLPIEIKAVAEGSQVPEDCALFTITNTDSRFGCLTNFIETPLMRSWYPITVASRSRAIVENITGYMEITSDNKPLSKFMLHDFGSRGATCREAACIGGAAHLLNSYGTDTVSAIKFHKDYYGADVNNVGFSVPATEHSIACSFGPDEGEFKYVRTQMERFPTGIVSLVSDTYHAERFVTHVIAGLKDEILTRHYTNTGDLPNKIVIRPDSPRYKGDTPEQQVLWIVKELDKIFGHSINSKGFRVLHPAVGVIYGDSLSENQITDIYEYLQLSGWSAESTVVGQGGGLMQKLNRDTCRFAIKASRVKVAGVWKNIQKTPLDKSKSSKTGKQKLVLMTDDNGVMGYKTINETHPLFHDLKDEMQVVFRNGALLVDHTLEEVRNNTGLWNTEEKLK